MGGLRLLERDDDIVMIADTMDGEGPDLLFGRIVVCAIHDCYNSVHTYD